MTLSCYTRINTDLSGVVTLLTDMSGERYILSLAPQAGKWDFIP